MSFSENDNSNSNDWYVYDGKEVTGPLLHGELKKRFEEQPTIFASKRGFSKWYKLNEVRDQFKKSNSQDLSPEMVQFHAFFKQNTSSTIASSAAAPTTIRKVSAATIPSSLKKTTATQQKAVKSEPQKNTPTFKRTSEQNPKQLYMILKGRLRLGQISETFEVAFVNYFFSLTFSSFFWFRRLRQEMIFHLTGKYTRGRFFDFLVLVPVVNAFQFYRMAKLIQDAELQNMYKKTEPMAAFFLGLCPPLAISYLQEMANKHWILHVANVHKK